MFHPLFNEDSKVSKVRVFCLITISFCMLALAILRQIHVDEKNIAKALTILNSEQIKTEKALTFFKEKELKKELFSNRVYAISEIIEAADFLSSCGTMNKGYIGCKLSFSDKLLSHYNPIISSFGDGYTISLKAVGFQKSDKCSLININSQGLFEGFDKSGRINETCIPSKYKNRHITSIRRATDNLDGNIAPSGLKPLYK